MNIKWCNVRVRANTLEPDAGGWRALWKTGNITSGVVKSIIYENR